VGDAPPDRDPEVGADSPDGLRLPRSSRIRSGGDIRSVFRRGKRRKTAHLDVFLYASPVARPRIGLVVAKHGHDSVERNRLKRRLREVARTSVLPRLWASGKPVDVLVRTRRGAYRATFAELQSELAGITEEICSGRAWSG